MKRRSAKAKGQPSPPAQAATAPLSAGRKWLFRVAAMSLPVLALVLVELGLRLAGYGYPTGFFRKTMVDGQEFLVNSDTFTYRFFPPELARWPEPIRIPAAKPPDTTRIFIFGESAAMGDPQPAYGAGRFLEVLLRARFPQQKFEVVNTGITAVNSHVILPVARECAKQHGDVWIVYMGNNEMVGPFGAATIFGGQAPPLATVRLNLALQRLRLGQLAVATLRKLGTPTSQTSWEGMRMFLKNQIPPDDPRRAAAYRNFEANLREILRAGLAAGAEVILSTVSVNLRDCPPFASLGNSNLPPAGQEEFAKYYRDARAAAEKGGDVAAVHDFEQAARLDPGFAELQYRWAECLLRSSNAAAKDHYQAACDADALPFRADTPINRIIRRVGGEFSGQSLVMTDAESELAAASPFGIAGPEVFFEHVHFNFRGNYLLARLWAEQVARQLPEQVRDAGASAWASQAECERDLGLTVWNRGFVLDLVVERMNRSPLKDQFNNPARRAAIQKELDVLRVERASTNAIIRSGEKLVRAIQRAPKDHWLYEGLASLYEAVGDLPRAAAAYRKVHELLPHDFYGNLQLGRFLGKVGKAAEGEPLLQQAARQRPYVPDAWVELGNVCMTQGKFAAALDAYNHAARLRPREASYAASQAVALARLNRNAEAITTFRQAIQLKPDSWESHFELAGVLVADHRLEEAVPEYNEAIRLNPAHATSRINLGVVFFRQGRLDAAIKQFEEVLQRDPNNAAAANYLSEARARAGGSLR